MKAQPHRLILVHPDHGGWIDDGCFTVGTDRVYPDT